MGAVEHPEAYVLLHLLTESGLALTAKSETRPDPEKGTTLHFTAIAEQIHYFVEATEERVDA